MGEGIVKPVRPVPELLPGRKSARIHVTDHPIGPYLARFPIAAAFTYVALVVVLVFAIWVALADIAERRQAAAAAADMLARLEGRAPLSYADGGTATGPVPTGSPFLEGQTVTVAGAALLQRVTAVATRCRSAEIGRAHV